MSTLQDRPICLQCGTRIESNAEIVFEAICGHQECASSVFHPICLLEFRERREESFKRFQEWIAHMREHHERYLEEEEENG